jgi:hypothetical protein
MLNKLNSVGARLEERELLFPGSHYAICRKINARDV